MRKNLIFILLLTILFFIVMMIPINKISGAVTITQWPTPSVINQETGGTTTLQYSVSSPPKLMSVYIVDFDKRVVVKTIYENYSVTTGGPFSVSWSGRTDYYNQKVANGQYYFKIVEKTTSGGLVSTTYARISCNGTTGSIGTQVGFMYNPFYWGNFRSCTAYYDINSTTGVYRDYMNGTISYDGHKGTDFGCVTGTNLYAPFTGVVLYLRETAENGTNEGYPEGNYIVIRSSADSSVIVRYLHLSKNSIIPNLYDTVNAGQLIAQSDNTGYSEGPHLHHDICVGTSGSYDPAKRVCPYQNRYWIQDPRTDAYPGY